MGKTKVGLGSATKGKVTSPKLGGGGKLTIKGGFKAMGTGKGETKK
jgi:hypothetical protein